MAESTDTHEVLVHIAAPSTAQDDARYTAQVAAILEFQSASQWMQTSDPDPRHHAHSSDGAQVQTHEASILREASRPAVPSDFPADSPAPRSHDSLESLISVIPDSQEIVELVSASASHAALSDPPQRTSESALTRQSKATAQPAPQANSIQVPGLHSTPISVSSDPDSDPSHSPTAHVNLTSLPLQIHPPKPPISTAPFTTHITPTLSMLTERLNPARTYRPSRQTRPLDPLERGYWLVRFAVEPDTRDSAERAQPETHWPAALFQAFWSFLQDFVGKDGRAGWGVWCILEEASPVESSATHLALKVYTWGEVAMHVYLLLFLASERQVRGMGIQWRDAREEVVIQMP